MNDFKCVVAGLFIMLLTSCAGQTLQPETSAKLQSGNVATMYFMNNKKIKYNEMVYKVFWNETRQQEASFSTLWDIDKDLSAKYSKALIGCGVNSRSAPQLLSDDADYQALATCIANTRRKEDGKYPPLELSSKVSEKLNELGIDLLLVIRTTCFVGTTTSMFDLLSVHMPSIIVVYDVNSGMEVFSNLFYVGSGNIRYEKSPREIEKDNLKMLKEATYGWIEAKAQKSLSKSLQLTAGH
jgi:hypothetical protein